MPQNGATLTTEDFYSIWVDRSLKAGAVMSPHSFYANVIVNELDYPITFNGFRYHLRRLIEEGKVTRDGDTRTWRLKDLHLTRLM